MKAKLLPRITEAMLYLLAAFVLLCAVTLYIPGSGWDQIIAAYCQTDSDPVALRVFLTAAAVFALWILFELLLVMRTVSTDPFVQRNVHAFVRMGIAAELAGAMFTVRCAAYFTPMTAVCAIVMLLAGLFALVLAGLFRRAVAFKLENDLTI